MNSTTGSPLGTNKKIARIAGLFYFTYIIASIIAEKFGRFVFVEATLTVDHILANEASFRLGVVISMFSQVLFLLAAWALYRLLKPVNKDIALLFLLFNLGGFAIFVFSHVNLAAGLVLVSGADYLKAFQPDQLQALATVFINLYKYGSTIAQIPFGIWLLPLGYLVYKSNFLPKILGILLMADCFGLLIYVCQRFLFPAYTAIAYPCWALGFLAEFGLAVWLLVKGVKKQDQPAIN